MYQAILLDVYGTVVHDDDEPLADVCAQVARAAGGVDAATVAREWDARICRLADAAFGEGFRSLADLTLASFAETAAHFGADVDARAACAEQMAFRRRPPLFPDALNRGPGPPTSPVRPTYTVPSLTALLPHLDVRRPADPLTC